MRVPALLLLLASGAWAEEPGPVRDPFEWRQLLGSASHDGRRERQDSIHVPKVAWHAPKARGQPTLLGGWLYAGGPVLGRYRASDGKFEEAPTADARAVGKTPILAAGMLVARHSDRSIEAYSLDLRRRIWRTATQANVNSFAHPLAVQGEIVVANAGNSVLALRLRDGKILWRFPTGRGGVAMTPAIANGRVYFGCRAGTAYALELASGKRVWQLPGAVSYGGPHPVVAGGTLFLAERCVPFENTPDPFGKILAIDAASGKVRWSRGYGKFGVGTPASARDRIVFGSFQKVMVLDPKSGRDVPPRIAIDVGAFGTPAIVGATLYLGTEGSLEARDRKSGEVKWRLRIPGVAAGGRPHSVRGVVHTGSRIYVETTNGLYCVAQDPNRRGVRPRNLTVTAPE